MESKHLNDQGNRRITLSPEEQVPLLKLLSGQAVAQEA
jgi:hypothetical protein